MAIDEIEGLMTRSSGCKGRIEGTSMMMESMVHSWIRVRMTGLISWGKEIFEAFWFCLATYILMRLPY